MRLISPWSKATCPYCFEQFHLSQAPRRLTRPGSATEPDEQVGRYLAVPPPDLGKVVHPDRDRAWQRLLARVVVEEDGDSRKICPHCHMFLPTKTANGELTSEVIAIIGARSSGKSNYLGVLLNLLERRYMNEVGFVMFDQDSFSLQEMKPISSRKLYRERYYARLYDPAQPRAIDQTRSARQNPDLRIPLIYRLQFPKQPRHYLTRPLGSVCAMDLALFDAAGEDMDDQALLSQFYRFILRATGIIFLLDPFQYPGIRQRVPAELRQRLPRIDTDPSEIVARVINLFEERGGVRSGQKIAVPVAFALSKSDMLRPMLHAGSGVLKDSVHRGGFDLEDCQRVSNEVMECVKRWDSPQLVDLARGHFARFCFFAVSALGGLPDEQFRLRSLSPLRVADPLLWLLHERGYIQALQRV